MTQEEIKAFFRFLKEIDVYNAYIRNLRIICQYSSITPTTRLAQMENICPIGQLPTSKGSGLAHHR